MIVPALHESVMQIRELPVKNYCTVRPSLFPPSHDKLVFPKPNGIISTNRV